MLIQRKLLIMYTSLTFEDNHSNLRSAREWHQLLDQVAKVQAPHNKCAETGRDPAERCARKSFLRASLRATCKWGLVRIPSVFTSGQGHGQN